MSKAPQDAQTTVTPSATRVDPRQAEAALLSTLAVATLLAGAGIGLDAPTLACSTAVLVAAVLSLPRWAGETTRLVRGVLVIAAGVVLALATPAMSGLLTIYCLVVAAAMPLQLRRPTGNLLTVVAAAGTALPMLIAPQSGLDSLGPQSSVDTLAGVLVVLATGLFSGATARSVEDAYRIAHRNGSHAADADARLSHAIRHDRLTGLPNRDALLDRAVRALAHAEELGGIVGLLVLDVDRFAAVQDTVGAEGAEEVLGHVATRLRASRPEHDLVARIGEARFAVLIEGVGPEGCSGIARRMTSLLAEPLSAAGQDLSVTCSVGVVLSTPDLTDATELLRAAEEAARAAQSTGRSRWAEFDRAMRVHSISQSFLELELRQALRAGALGVAFQPIIRLAHDGQGEQMAAVEALARWSRRDGTAVPPQRFLSMADDLGLGATLGFQVLDRALEALAHWKRAGAVVPQVSVNVSRSQLADPDFAHTVNARLSAQGLSPQCLAVDMRSADLEDDDVISTLNKLRSLGVTVCVSGLGRAGTSLSGLAGAPVDRVIIDRSLLTGRAGGHTVARHLVALCRDLGLDTVADGVETADQLATVRALGIDHAQGFLLGRPVAADDVVPAMTTWLGTTPLRQAAKHGAT